MLVFIYDISIYFKTEMEHTEHLRTVRQALREHELYAQLSKYDFWLLVVIFLDHVIPKEGIKMDS